MESSTLNVEHLSGSKRSSIGRKYKKGHTYADHQIGVAEGLVNNNLTSGDSTPIGNPDDSTPPLQKNDKMIIGGFKGLFYRVIKNLFGAKLS